MAQQLVICGIGRGMTHAIAKIVEMGVEVVVVDFGVNAQIHPYLSRVVPADPNDAQAVLAALREAGVRTPQGVMSLGFDNPPVIAHLCRAFGCPGISEEAATQCTAKDQRIAVLGRSGLNVPPICGCEQCQ